MPCAGLVAGWSHGPMLLFHTLRGDTLRGSLEELPARLVEAVIGEVVNYLIP